jgi:putative Holliday junction resolvase
MARLAELVGELEAERVVVGLPLTLAGGDSTQTREAREFAARLERRLDVPVELFDERFTTVLAARSSPHARSSEDSRAAAHLLEGWLSAHAERRPDEEEV